MDEESRKQYELLSQDCIQLHSDLEVFGYLFSESNDRVLLMNVTAAIFFKQLQKTLWNSLLLQLCRLTDPAQTGNKNNLSLSFFLETLAPNQNPASQDRAKPLVKRAFELSNFARDWRNRRIAHRDLLNATGVNLCEEATLGKVREAAKAIGEAMDAMNPDSVQTEWVPVSAVQGCTSLLYYLQEGKTIKNQRGNALS